MDKIRRVEIKKWTNLKLKLTKLKWKEKETNDNFEGLRIKMDKENGETKTRKKERKIWRGESKIKRKKRRNAKLNLTELKSEKKITQIKRTV